ncbi:hypothetical protein [Microvirga brassicacearum]|uniref:Uncharacterized protein n=1 Tax=Microvirga brassicacearum TaxID=2580413 RepID=A0A5N3PIA2_9HYPH|nr:hypothetical protein [Microvirga brassicacearum]KAB0269454.1 hypothetical protein FEZ63_00685 [Microvirga brassicacearum]
MSIANPVAAHFEAPAASPRPAFSLLRRFIAGIADAISVANQRRAHREIGRFVARNGGLLTDDVERQIGNRFGQG